jgi:hypothetical protein
MICTCERWGGGCFGLSDVIHVREVGGLRTCSSPEDDTNSSLVTFTNTTSPGPDKAWGRAVEASPTYLPACIVGEKKHRERDTCVTLAPDHDHHR